MSQPRKVPLDKEFLRKMYHDEGLTVRQIAERLGTVHQTVSENMRKLGIPMTRQKIPRDKAVLHKMYVVEKMTAKEIGLRFDAGQDAVLNALREVGIEVKKKGFDPVYKRYASWDDWKVKQIFYGSLLGDGGLYLNGRGGLVVQYIEGHGEKQDEYVQWKADLFRFTYYRSLTAKSDIVKIREGAMTSYIASKTHPFLDKAYDELYRSGKRNVSEILSRLGDVGLLIWYLDDGSWNPPESLVQFSTNSFTHEEQEQMCAWFEAKYGVRPAISEFDNHGPGEVENRQERLSLCGDRARKIIGIMRAAFEQVNPPASLRYKLYPDDWATYREKKRKLSDIVSE